MRALGCLQLASLPLRESAVSRYEFVAFFVFEFLFVVVALVFWVIWGEWDCSDVCDVGRNSRVRDLLSGWLGVKVAGYGRSGVGVQRRDRCGL